MPLTVAGDPPVLFPGQEAVVDLYGNLLAGVALSAQSLDGGARGWRCLAWQ